MSKDPIVSVSGVSKVYPIYSDPIDRLKEALHPFRKKYHTDKKVLESISFDLFEGDVIGVLGRNGAGKSTLLKIITGIINPTSGNYVINGQVASLLELGAGFDFELTGLENIYLNSALNGISESDVTEKLNDIISFADIGDYINQPVKNYSSGMFARLAFSTAVHFIPDVLIIDEALSVGDVFFQQKCNSFIKKHLANTTVILVTHDMHTVSKMANKVMVIDDGKVLYSGEVIDGIELYTRLGQGVSFDKNEFSDSDSDSENTNFSTSKAKSLMLPIEQEKISGSLEVQISKFAVTVNGKDTKNVSPNDIIKIVMQLENHTGDIIDNPIVGYFISDRQGYQIFGHNTLSSNFHFDLKSSTTVEFEFTWPVIADNSYFITLGVGIGDDAFIHQISCWAHNLIQLDSVSRDVDIHCLFNNPMKSFNYNGA
ncbi:ABC transporter ATP-binding protein [Vibrio cyclitrophicus]